MTKFIVSLAALVLIFSLIAYCFGLHFDVQTVMQQLSSDDTLQPLNINSFTIIPNNYFDGQDWGVFEPVKNVLQVGADGINTLCYVGANTWRTIKLFARIIGVVVTGGSTPTTPSNGTGNDTGGWRDLYSPNN